MYPFRVFEFKVFKFGTRMTRISADYLFTGADNGTRMTRIERISADFFILSFYWSGQWNADDADEMD